MEAGTVTVAGSEYGTGSKTMADMGLLAADKLADQVALPHKVGDEWVKITYADFGVAVREIGLGLIDLGMQHADKVAILANSSPEWVFTNFAILSSGCASVSIYQTNSPEECHYVLEHSEAHVVFVEDAAQLAKTREVERTLPSLEHVIIFDAADADEGAIALDDLRARGRNRGTE